jgi:poly(hydroxyalkanoate) depolymerase family esterase
MGAPVRAGRWLAGTYHQPRSSSFLILGQAQLHYRLYWPAAATEEPLPLLLMLHGCSQTANDFAAGSRINRLAETQPCAVLYPEQARRSNSLRCWNWFDPEALDGHGEAALLMQALQNILQEHRIDATRLYLAGFSAGGAMASVLTATYPQVFAGCAIHSGVMFRAARSAAQALQAMRHGALQTPAEVAQQLMHPPATQRPVPTLVIHGADDAVVHPVNAEQIAQLQCLLAQPPAPASGALELGPAQWLESGGRRYRLRSLRQGEDLLLQSILVEGLAHAWSGGDAQHRFFDAAGPDASRLILDFLQPLRRQGAADFAVAASVRAEVLQR